MYSNTYYREKAKKFGISRWNIKNMKTGKTYENVDTRTLVDVVSDASSNDYGTRPARKEFIEQAKLVGCSLNEGGHWGMPMFPYIDIELVSSEDKNNVDKALAARALGMTAPLMIGC